MSEVEAVVTKEVKVTKLNISLVIATDTTICEDQLFMELHGILGGIKIAHSDFTGVQVDPIQVEKVHFVPEGPLFAPQKVENLFYMKTTESIADGEWEELEDLSAIVGTTEPTVANDGEWSFYD